VAGEVKHSFTSAKSDGGDATLVKPSDWNASHNTTETDVNRRLAPDGAGGLMFANDSAVLAAGKIYAAANFR